jgi:hypothetical protein
MVSQSSPSTSSSSSSDTFTPTEWTQQSMLSDVMQQKGLLIGAGVVIGSLWLFRRRSAPQEKAARRLVRKMRHVDDASDMRDVLGNNLPAIVRPALLMAVAEIQRQVHRGFRLLEHEIEHL